MGVVKHTRGRSDATLLDRDSLRYLGLKSHKDAVVRCHRGPCRKALLPKLVAQTQTATTVVQRSALFKNCGALATKPDSQATRDNGPLTL